MVNQTKRPAYGHRKLDSLDIMMAALRFNEKINERDLDGLVELMTDDHAFIDKLGEIHQDKRVMKKGWRSFFDSYPDYRTSSREYMW